MKGGLSPEYILKMIAINVFICSEWILVSLSSLDNPAKGVRD